MPRKLREARMTKNAVRGQRKRPKELENGEPQQKIGIGDC